jgi:hypothetical protein
MNFYLFIVSFISFSLSIFFKLDDSNFEDYRKNFIENYQIYQAEKELGMKAFNFDISNNGFIRYRRTAANNRMEYFSVRLEKVKQIDFLGNENAGWIVLKCEKESVIYQTYRDTKGDVDNMIDELRFPAKAIELQKINEWNFDFNEMKASFLNTLK